MSAFTKARFRNRWLIEGTLTAVAELRIGSGYQKADQRVSSDRSVLVGQMCRDTRGRPYIPGRSLKGVLRHRAEFVDVDAYVAGALERIFGIEGSTTQEPSGRFMAGHVSFEDARLIEESVPAQSDLPHYDPKVVSGLRPSTAIDRWSRSAKDRTLRHAELVPRGTAFRVRLTAEGLDDEDVAALLRMLSSFDGSQSGSRIGSATSNHFGMMTWALGFVRRLERDQAQAWLRGALNGDSAAPGPAHYRPVALPVVPVPSGHASRASVSLLLEFDEGFLVLDPPPESRSPKGSVPQLQPLRDENGRAFLPARSFRGVFRSQAERILRTLGGSAECLGSRGRGGCSGLERGRDVVSLCMACQVFGAAGWASLVEVTDFRDMRERPAMEYRHELIAIDRFTGGGADQKKFAIQAPWRPILEGSLAIDARRLEDVGDWAIALIALVLRDLCEGDLSFGHGSARGYGHCRATILGSELPRMAEQWGLSPGMFQGESLKECLSGSSERMANARAQLVVRCQAGAS